MPRPDPDSGLSAFMNAVRTVAGQDGIGAVTRLKGGMRVAIPGAIRSPKHWLVEALGLDRAEQVVLAIRTLDPHGRPRGLAPIAIPHGATAARHRAQSALRSEAVGLLRAGVPVARIAHQLGMGQSTIFILKRQLKLTGATHV